MNLTKYENKYVKIKTVDKQTFEGFVGDYIDEFDSPNGKEMIILDVADRESPIGIFSDEIVNISVSRESKTA